MTLTSAFTTKFGTEIEFTGIQRMDAVQVIADVLTRADGTPTTPYYIGTYYDSWGVKDADGREWKMTYDGSIDTEGHNKYYSCELVTPILDYQNDMSTLQTIIRELRKKGAKVNNSCGQHVHIDGAGYTAGMLKNMIHLMYGHQELLGKALKIDDRRRTFCKELSESLLKRVDSHKNLDMKTLEDEWYYGQDSLRTTHYNNSRYHMLNLHSFFHGHGTLEFRCFNSTLHAGEVRANITLCLAMDKMARTQKRISADKGIQDNDKFAMRTWMNRMGLIGDEFKAVREHMMKNLTGCAAWRFGIPA